MMNKSLRVRTRESSCKRIYGFQPPLQSRSERRENFRLVLKVRRKSAKMPPKAARGVLAADQWLFVVQSGCSRRGRPVSTRVAKLQGRTEVQESSLNSFANYSCQRRQLRSRRLTRRNLRPAGACATDPGDAFTGSLCIVRRGAALRDTVAGLASSLLLG